MRALHLAPLAIIAAIGTTLGCASSPERHPTDAGASADGSSDASTPDSGRIDARMPIDTGTDAAIEPDGGAVCGDGVVEGGEECDTGSARSDTVADACRTDCTAAGCGDGVSDSGEACDGLDLHGQTCVAQGYAGGTLACTAACVFDTSMCEAGPSCGNGVREAAEACDGSDLGAATCATQVAGSIGTLSCTMACAFDTSMCSVCGDAVATGTEVCDGADLRGQSCLTQGFLSGTLGCASSCSAFDATSCSNAPVPSAAGQIVISEIMKDPSALTDAAGEWFEVHNPTTADLNLFGCVVTGTGGGSDTFTIMSNIVVPPGGYATFAISPMPGFTPTYVWTGGFLLANAGDGITLTCGGTVIDSVIYDATAFPSTPGSSLTLSPAALDATANDSGASWCVALSTFGGGATPDRGTPGAANDRCSLPIGFCRLQFPPTLTTTAGASTPVYGRVFVAGLTELTPTNDPDPRVVGAVGVGPDGSDPATATGWTWTAAMPNALYGPGSPGHEPNNDEYVASLVGPAAAGMYDYAFRFSGDRGRTWLYCDLDGATTPAEYSIAAAGSMTVTGGGGGTAWINEIHYDNSGTDADEGIEIAGTAGTSLTGYQIVLYNGTGGTTYGTTSLTGTIPDQSGGFGTLWFPIAAIQNGAPDGIALIDPSGVVLLFLSYEGTLMAANGPAMGMMSVDIGVAELGTEPLGSSLQLSGTGSTYAAFTWTAPAPNSRGAINTGQTLM